MTLEVTKLTRDDIEQAARLLGEDRYRLWLKCPAPHDWRALPTTQTDEHYCSKCCSLFAPQTGEMLNQPEPPKPRR